MGKSVLKIKGYKPEDIRELMSADSAFVVATRLNMVYQVAKGLPSREVAKIYDISFKQVTNWVHRFEEKVIEGLNDLPERGRKSILSVSDLEKIRNTVLNEPPVNFGYKRKRWSGPLLLKWVNNNYGTNYHSAQTYKLLDRIGVEFRKEEGYVVKN